MSRYYVHYDQQSASDSAREVERKLNSYGVYNQNGHKSTVSNVGMTSADSNLKKRETSTPAPQPVQPKMGAHLLDHGYGATPQPQMVERGNGKSTTKPADLTNYYKVIFNGKTRLMWSGKKKTNLWFIV